MKQTHAFSRIKAIFLFLFLIILSLSGCETQKYDESEAEGVITSGNAILKDWLSSNMPGAEIISSKVDEFAYPGGGKHYLNGYVSGELQNGEEIFDYTVSTKTGQVYLSCDLEVFGDIAYEYILDALGFSEMQTIDDYAVWLELPYCYEGESKEYSLRNTLQIYHVLPAEIALLIPDYGEETDLAVEAVSKIREYIENPVNRDLLGITLWGKVAEEIDLKQYGLQKIHSLRYDNGIYLYNFSFYDSDESIDGSAWLSDYSRREWVEKDDGLVMRAEMESFGDTEDTKSPDAIKHEVYSYSADDIVVENAETGFKLHPAKDKGPSYYLYAKEGSPYLAHSFIACEEEFETPVFWKFSEDLDLWSLCTAEGERYFFYQPCELIIRDE